MPSSIFSRSIARVAPRSFTFLFSFIFGDHGSRLTGNQPVLVAIIPPFYGTPPPATQTRNSQFKAKRIGGMVVLHRSDTTGPPDHLVPHKAFTLDR